MKPTSVAWTIVAAVLCAIVLSACSGFDLDACGSGMTLRHTDRGYVCEGFGTGFNWRTATPKGVAGRVPW